MVWRRPGDRPLSEPMMVSLLPHLCVTRPQWVKTLYQSRLAIFRKLIILSSIVLLIFHAVGIWTCIDMAYSMYFACHTLKFALLCSPVNKLIKLWQHPDENVSCYLNFQAQSGEHHWVHKFLLEIGIIKILHTTLSPCWYLHVNVVWYLHLQ